MKTALHETLGAHTLLLGVFLGCLSESVTKLAAKIDLLPCWLLFLANGLLAAYVTHSTSLHGPRSSASQCSQCWHGVTVGKKVANLEGGVGSCARALVTFSQRGRRTALTLQKARPAQMCAYRSKGATKAQPDCGIQPLVASKASA